MATSTLGSGTLVLAGTTSGTTTVTATAVAGTTTLTLPAATDTLVGKATTDTLTNKTLTGAVMNGTLGATTPSTVAATTISASSTATFAAGAAGTPSITTTGDTNTGIFFPAADTIAFAEGGAEAMRLDSAGNMGLGVTPSAWSSTFKGFQLGSTGSIWAIASGNGGTYYGNNYIYGASGRTYLTTGTAVELAMSNGKFEFSIAPSGTAGNAISFTQAMTLDASGNLGIGTTSPSYRLHAVSSASVVSRLGSSGGSGAFINFIDSGASPSVAPSVGAIGNNLVFMGDGSSSERARIDSSGNLLIGTAGLPVANGTRLSISGSGEVARILGTTTGNPSLALDKSTNDSTTGQVFATFTINNQGAGSGQINANGASQAAFGSFSDRRLKQNIVDLPPQLANIMALRPVEFDYIESEGGGHQTGFIAQEMETIFPDSVGERSDGMKTVTGWNKTEAILIKAIQEQQALITTLTARITALEGA
jgi:hypothetical protein